MQETYVIIGGNQESREDKTINLIGNIFNKKIDLDWISKQPDIKFIKPLEDKKFIGIAQVKEGIKFLNEKPFNLKYKFLIIPEAQNLTKDSQNALLKTLEEPPSYVTIILSTKTEQALLETVISRCKKIYTKRIKNTTENKTWQYQKILGLPLGERLDVAGEIAKEEREEIVQILENWVEDSRELITKEISIPTNIQNTKKILQVLKYLEETNVNTRVTLEALVINLV